MKQVAAGACVEYVKGGKFAVRSIQRATTEASVAKALAKVGIESPFLRYLVYRDLRIFYPHLPASAEVGDGAVEVLDAVEPGPGTKSVRLKNLTDRVRVEVEEYDKELKMLCCRGWDGELTEHVLCEVRRFRKKDGRMRKGNCTEVGVRQRRREWRVKLVWKVLGYKVVPTRCRGQRKAKQ